MTENVFKKVFTQFPQQLLGAFHEALEAQSVTPRRLAGSLFDALQAEHRAFEAMYVGLAKSALDGLDTSGTSMPLAGINGLTLR